MTKYSVKELSKLAGVSVRTLHHYDKIGLLKPAERTEKKYRYYSREQLLKLQQILFYKTLDFPLKEIIEILNDPEFDLMQALLFQQKEISKRSTELNQLLETLEKTIVELKTGKKMTDKEIYEGFTQSERESIREEVKQKWGASELHNSEQRIEQLSKHDWDNTKKRGEEIAKKMANLMHLKSTDIEVQIVVQEHFKLTQTFYEVTEERYLGLSKLYVDDERFKVYYDKHKKGLAQFLADAMVVFCKNGMKI